MKKIIAVVLSISLLFASEGPVVAQAIIPGAGRIVANAAKAQKTATLNAIKASSHAPTNYVLKSAQNPARIVHTLPLIPTVPVTPVEVQPPLLPKVQSAQLETAVTRTVQKAVLANPLSFEQIIYRANNGQTAFLPQAILKVPNQVQRAQLLRSAFVTAGAAGEASIEQLEIARRFWRTDLVQRLHKIDTTAMDLATPDTLLPTIQALQDAAALALLGTEEDIAILKQLFNRTKSGIWAPVTATTLVRGYLTRQHWSEIETFFTQHDGYFADLQNETAAYAQAHRLPMQIAPSQQRGAVLADNTKNLLQGWGPVLQNTTDPRGIATQQWMQWVENQRKIPSAPITDEVIESANPRVTLPKIIDTSVLPNLTATSAQLQTAALPQASVSPAASKALWKWFQKKPASQAAPLADNLGGAVPPVRLPNAETVDSPLARFQRASLYAASFVMGLEVATPVIANFGTSFGLSLQDNILVAAATYTPYSLGALLSNQMKKIIGRKGSMQLGLAMMGAGFLGGVSWVGLDGSFVPQADTMMQFYKALACITLASTGGVFVHNSVGPIMTELNAKASELIRQKRSAMTEFSRALGMAASFAFPYIATKMLGMDWSFTFALPIPFVAASLLGTGLIKLPNTKPAVKQAVQAVNQAKKSLLQRLKNNEYIRLFKEEKGAGALLAGLGIMNAVEVGINNGFLFLLPSLTKDPSSQYLFGMAQFAAPFLLGRYLAKRFLGWFPNRNLSVATGLAAAGAGAAILPGIVDNVYALTSALFLAETGISTLFTLSFARTAKNPATVDRLTTLIVASALSCAVGPMIFSGITQTLINLGMGAPSATAAAMIGIPAALTILSSRLFRKVEQVGVETKSSLSKLMSFIKESISFPKFRRKRS